MEQSRNWRRDLPHLRPPSAAYFITWRLNARQQPLTPDERSEVASAISFFAGKRFDLFAFVVMDDHVHALCLPKPGNRIEAIIHSWKSYSAHRLQRRLGRRGSVWQSEYFDRYIRDDGNRPVIDVVTSSPGA